MLWGSRHCWIFTVNEQEAALIKRKVDSCILMNLYNNLDFIMKWFHLLTVLGRMWRSVSYSSGSTHIWLSFSPPPSLCLNFIVRFRCLLNSASSFRLREALNKVSKKLTQRSQQFTKFLVQRSLYVMDHGFGAEWWFIKFCDYSSNKQFKSQIKCKTSRTVFIM